MYRFATVNHKEKNQSQKIVILYEKIREELYRKGNAVKLESNRNPDYYNDPGYYHEIGEIRGGMQIADLLEEMFPRLLAESIENDRNRNL